MISLWNITYAQNSEMQSAYEYAYRIGITTMPTIEQANMQGNLIRAHMAKMMVNYAKNVLGKTPDTSKSCRFDDINNQSQELKGYILQACQMGIMGQGISTFRPNDKVTRAEFGTVLSRILRWESFDGGTPYYTRHLQALKDAWIMKQIDTPNMLEIRGYVMIMLQRVDQWISAWSSECEDEKIKEACDLGFSSCPIQCLPTLGWWTLQITKSTESYHVHDAYVIWSLKIEAKHQDSILQGIGIETQAGLDDQFRAEIDGVQVTPKVAWRWTNTTLTLPISNIRITQWTSVYLHILSTTPHASVSIPRWWLIQTTASSVQGDFPIIW